MLDAFGEEVLIPLPHGLGLMAGADRSTRLTLRQLTSPVNAQGQAGGFGRKNHRLLVSRLAVGSREAQGDRHVECLWRRS